MTCTPRWTNNTKPQWLQHMHKHKQSYIKLWFHFEAATPLGLQRKTDLPAINRWEGRPRHSPLWNTHTDTSCGAKSGCNLKIAAQWHDMATVFFAVSCCAICQIREGNHQRLMRLHKVRYIRAAVGRTVPGHRQVTRTFYWPATSSYFIERFPWLNRGTSGCERLNPIYPVEEL